MRGALYRSEPVVGPGPDNDSTGERNELVRQAIRRF